MSMMTTSVYEMVNQVLGDARKKVASSGTAKVAAKPQSTPPASFKSQLSDGYLSKLANACDHLAVNIHQVADERTPKEKLAEYAAINRALTKVAVEGEAHDPNTKTPSEFTSPNSVPTEVGGTGVGGSSAIPVEAAKDGPPVLDAGESGEATPAHVPDAVPGSEAPTPTSSANALETNKGMMMPAQPDDLIKQPGGDVHMGEKVAQARERVLAKLAKRHGFGLDAAINVKQQKLAQLKQAANAENPASIMAGTNPVLQSEAGVPSPLSQGSEVGSNTPRELAPNSGAGAGRELVSSNESAIDATKGQAKAQNKGTLSELLVEPAMSAAHDKVLDKSLENTSTAGVKISAARALLKKFAGTSPENARKLAMMVQQAQGPAVTAAGEPVPDAEEAAEEEAPPPPPPEAEAVPEEAMPEEEVPEVATEDGEIPESLDVDEGSLEDVTPEELALAEELLAAQEGGEEEDLDAAPVAGEEDTEKVQQFGGMASPAAPPPMASPPVM
jgi:hypothetical protein